MKSYSGKRKPYSGMVIILILLVIIIKSTGWFQNKSDISSTNTSFRNTSNLIFTKHARCRMDCRNITTQELKEIIENGKVNQSKSGIGLKGDSTYAIEGYSHEKQHIRVVVAPNKKGLVIITCIDLEKEWQCDCN